MELRMEERPIGVADDRMIERVLLHCLNSQMARDADSPIGRNTGTLYVLLNPLTTDFQQN